MNARAGIDAPARTAGLAVAALLATAALLSPSELPGQAADGKRFALFHENAAQPIAEK